MALLLFLRFGIVLQLIGLYLVTNGPYLSVYAGANVAAPESHLRIEIPPPPEAVISQSNAPLQLPCRATINDVTVTKTSHSDIEFYSWYKNGEKISPGRRNDYYIFDNGTLRLPANERGSGVYRCLVNVTEIGFGAVLSTECVVKYAVLKRNSIESNITVEAGQPIVLNCPIRSTPEANITWIFGNKTNINKLDGNRFFILRNGSLLINNITENDKGRYKCIAKNIFAAKERRQNVWSVMVDPPLPDRINSTGLLIPPLQNQTLYITAGEAIKLHCVSETNQIEWWFTHRTTGISVKISNSSIEILIKKATLKYDGIYKCSTKSDFQEFDVIVVKPPVIEQQLPSIKRSLASLITFTCNISGNPQPNITWYHNGIQLKNSYTVYFSRSTLRINSFDIGNEGIYQCFAKNIGGEATTYGSLNLRRKMDLANMPQRPENIKCYPVNYKKMYITFDSSPSLPYMMNLNIVTENPFKWNSILPKQTEANSSISLSDDLPILKPFVLFMRGLVRTAIQSLNGNEEQTFEVSLLSRGIKCATQGLNTNGIFFPNGVFIWWIQYAGITAKYFRIQFWHNTTSIRRTFQDTIIGTTQSINILYHTQNDIESNLTKIPISTEIISGDVWRSFGHNVAPSKLKVSKDNGAKNADSDDTIIEIKVPGNVTGMLIPNANKVTVRVFIITHENENLENDYRYVEWKTIENITSHNIVFRVVRTESRSITFAWNPHEAIPCMSACYDSSNIRSLIRHSQQIPCPEILDVQNVFTIRNLKPETAYRMQFQECKSEKYFGSIEIQTKPDDPGPITNYKVISNDGLKLVWEPPINPNGQLYYYVILWNFKNITHAANVTASEKSFKFPNVTKNDKFNITIRAVGASGVGLPIYIDLRHIETSYFENETSSSESALGIAVGVILSIICIFIFLLLFLRQRTKFKSSSQNDGRPSSPQEINLQNQTPCSVELHEIQTLIPKTENISRKPDTELSPSLLPNGNGIYYSRSDEDGPERQLDRIEEISIELCSSTPKFNRRKDESYEKHSPIKKLCTVSSNVIPHLNDNAQDLNLSRNSSSSNFFLKLKVPTNENAIQYHNGSLKNKLPPCTTHSIVAAKAEPTLNKKQLNTKTVESSQYLAGSNSNTPTLDDSHQKLLDSTLDSSTVNKFENSEQIQNSEGDTCNVTATTLVDMNESSHNQTNPVKKSNWNHRRPIIDPNG